MYSFIDLLTQICRLGVEDQGGQVEARGIRVLAQVGVRNGQVGPRRCIYIYIYIYMHIHMYTHVVISLSLSLHMYIYIYIYTHTYICYCIQ